MAHVLTKAARSLDDFLVWLEDPPDFLAESLFFDIAS